MIFWEFDLFVLMILLFVCRDLGLSLWDVVVMVLCFVFL